MGAGNKEPWGRGSATVAQPEFLHATSAGQRSGIQFLASSRRLGWIEDNSFRTKRPDEASPTRMSVYQLEYSNMKTEKTSLLGRFCGTFSIAMLALAYSIGGSSSVVRAEEPEVVTPSLHEIVVAPLVKAIEGLEQRLASLEGSLSNMAASFTSQRVVTKQICVADDSGAETCITKAQLDAVLVRIAQADLGQAAVNLAQSTPTATAEPTEATAATVESPAAPTAIPDDAAVDAPEPTTTGSLNSETDGKALVSYPDVEIVIAVEAESEE
jgi:hypothetical protein